MQRLSVNNGSDKVASNKEEVTTNNTNGQEIQTQTILAQELNDFFADNKNEKEQYNNVSSRVVQKEIMLYEITKTRPNDLEKFLCSSKNDQTHNNRSRACIFSSKQNQKSS